MDDSIVLTAEILQVISSDQAWYYSIVPKQVEKDFIKLFIDETKLGINTQDELELLFNRKVIFEKVTPEELKMTLGKYYRKNAMEYQKNTYLRILIF